MSEIENKGVVAGIDLGTTYSAIAWVNSSGNVEVIPNSDGYATTPSVVFMDGDTILVGREAARVALLEPLKTAECFKRDMGKALYHRDVDEREIRPEVLSAFVLKKLKQDAEKQIGEISGVVVTVPAFFDETRRKATQDACKIAGLNVLAIINEPSAAALGYGYGKHEKEEDESTFLVYDLGGGTFDVTLMRVSGDNDFETIGTDGDVECGGKDWNDRLIKYVAEEFKKETGVDIEDDPVSFQELALRAEDCKRTLSKISSVKMPVSHAGKHIKIPVTREKFREITVDLLTHTRTTIEILMDEKDLTWKDVDEVLLVGGSTHMLVIREMLEKITGKQISSKLDADLAVVKGAAIYAASLQIRKNPSLEMFDKEVTEKLSSMSHTNVNSHSLGLEIEEQETDRMMNHIIIPKNTPIPCKATSQFGIATTVSEAVCTIKINVLEGEAKNPEACINVGMCTIEGLPAGLPEGSPVDVTFSYSAEGRIHVAAVATEVNCKAETHIESRNGLSQESVDTHAKKLLKLEIV